MVYLVPDASDKSKQWPLEQFASLACYLTDEAYSVAWVIGPNRVELEYSIRKLGGTSVIQSLKRLLELFASAACVIGNDTD
jgi:ADP-heptose:LPS heptosyltransferase